MNNKTILFLIAIFSYVGFFFYPSSKISSKGFYNLNDKLWAHRVLNLSEIDKLSKEFAKCTSDKLKNKTSKKADDIKTKTVKKIEQGKKKFKNFNFKEKLKKFKNSKSLKEFTEK